MLSKLKYIGMGLGWYSIANLDRKEAKKNAYNKGYMLSQRFKNYPSWDKYVEPIVVNQFAFLFGVGNSFVKGLISDNDKPNPAIEESLDEIRNEIEIRKKD
jgi:hypothetical protein